MKSNWSESDSRDYTEKSANPELGVRLYTSHLLGRENDLVLYGGGNTSVKTTVKDVFGKPIPAIFVKASGRNMEYMEAADFIGLDYSYLRGLSDAGDLSDETLRHELQTHMVKYSTSVPSVEAMMHVFIPGKFVDHTHPSSIIALTNREDGEQAIKDALGTEIPVVSYVKAGFGLAKLVLGIMEKNPSCRSMILMHHGLLTWGESARESYETTIEIVTRAEEYLKSRLSSESSAKPVSDEIARKLYCRIAPVVRGILSVPGEDPEFPVKRIFLSPVISQETASFMESAEGKGLALQPPLTPDYLVRTKPFPLWVDNPDYENLDHFREQLSEALRLYISRYQEYIKRNGASMPAGAVSFDPYPRVVFLPGMGVVCAGFSAKDASIVKDITVQAIRTKEVIIRSGGKYRGLDENHLFDMEYHSFQTAKVKGNSHAKKRTGVALITGAAGAIGSGVSIKLLEAGWHVALTDLAGSPLDSIEKAFTDRFPDQVTGVPIDVSDPESVASGFDAIIDKWGGIDLVVINAGIAHVSPLIEMELGAFQKLEKVNTEGTLLLLRQSARHFTIQKTGGDIVLISTKNVFSPGAKFGAYSATKAASHQLARIASLEFADMDVRVNMVSPDAVFSHGETRSGLWSAVGPDRMKARGLDEKGLEEYYRNRNLLKARITSEHVAAAVLFFANRSTPTTGATIPVDGGLPDAVPR